MAIDLKARTAEIREARGKAMEATQKFNEVRSKYDGTPEKAVELREAKFQLGAYDVDEGRLVEQLRNDIYLEELEGRGEGSGPRNGTRGDVPEQRSYGQVVTEADGYKDWSEKRGANGFATIEMRTLLDTTGGVSGWTNGPGLFKPTAPNVFPPVNVQKNRLFMRDVITTVPTTYPALNYIRELNSAVNASGAQVVGEGQPKPEVKMEWAQYIAAAKKIAAWIPMTNEILADAPTLRGYVDSRLMYMLMLAEERELLNGDGTGNHLLGLLQTPGLQQSGDGSNADVIQQVIRATGKLEVATGSADWLAMHPADFWGAMALRHSDTFDGARGQQGGLPFGEAANSFAGLPVVRTTSLTPGQALVGSRNGAMILDREEAFIKVGDQHSDFFTNNKIVVLAEERLGLAVHRPDWFCKVLYTAPTL